MKVMKLDIKRIGGNDLAVDFECICPNERYKDNEVLRDVMKTRMHLYGYNDSYFFNTVNEKPREFKCNECGKKYTQQWFKEGFVEVKEVTAIERSGKHDSKN
jgi:hypothetical protein